MTARPLLVRHGLDVAGEPMDVLVVDGHVAASGSAGRDDCTVLDADGLVVAPGLIDLQVNGAAGIDITAEPERLWEVGAALARYGVTAFAPTVITSTAGTRSRALESLRRGRPAGCPAGAVPVGLHFEGPMLAFSHRGAHGERFLAAPSLELVHGWSRSAGVALATIAPELPGALEVIRALVGRGVAVSLGHTAARAGDVQAAVDAGATALTHLYNAMPPLHHRDPGPVGVALGSDRLVAGVIADGLHVDPLVLAATFRALGPARFLSVSDTTGALGIPDGPAYLGDREVQVADGAVRLPDGTLAGSAVSLLDCLDVLLQATGCSLADAVATATTTAAGLVGDASRGRLRVGSRADLVLLDTTGGALRAVTTVVAGDVVHDVRTGAR